MKNKHILAVLFAVTAIVTSNAQLSSGGHFYGQDAFRYSNWGLTGSARMQGLGGSYSALGADATNAGGNPAGLGFYNRSEISITPFYNALTANTTYQDTKTSLVNNNASVGQASLILHFEGIGTRRRSSALAITYSKQAYLPNQFDYVGTKNKSSMQDYFAERATGRNITGADLDKEYDINSGYSDNATAMAYQTYLIDPIKDGSTIYQRAESTLPSKQSGSYTSTGAVSQTNISYGANFDDKVYVGFGLGIAKIAYDYVGSHKEDFANGNVFNSFKYSDDLSTRGTGVNLSVGAIFKATQNLQIGTNLISPTWYSMSETYNSSIDINVKPNKIDPKAPLSAATAPNDFTYDLRTPLRANLGATYLFGRSGLISVDAEYVGYSLMDVSYTDDYDAASTAYAKQFSAEQKKAIQNAYSDVVNFKVGGEFRVDAFRVRAGVNYRPDPYRNNTDGISHSQTMVSAGVGYRSSVFFVDLAGVVGQYKSGFTPYELANKANYSSAQTTTNMTNIVASIGIFF